MGDKAWKATERAIARHLGGERLLPMNGRGDRPDIAHPVLAVEVKHRQTLPAWLKAAMLQARRSAGAGQLPVVVLHEAGSRHADDLVVVRLADFADWFGGLEATP